MECYICGQIAADADLRGEPYDLKINCPLCGIYKVKVQASRQFEVRERFSQEKRWMLAVVIRCQTERGGDVFEVSDDILNSDEEFDSRVAALIQTRPVQKANLLLRYLANKSNYIGHRYSIDRSTLYPVAHCQHPEELKTVLSYLDQSEFVNASRFKGKKRPEEKLIDIEVTIKGWSYLESLEKNNLESSEAFVAMSFHQECRYIYDQGINPLKDETGYSMLRVDGTDYNDGIVDEIMSLIRQSRFIIADVTRQTNGVYWEAGFAKGLGLPVIWTCDKKDMGNVHFDAKHLNIIDWENMDDLKERLKNRILGTVGRPSP